jgi:competence protein ComEA
MNKFIALLFALLMVAFNAFAAVNVNTATPEQLDAIKGVGPSKAKAIVDYRTKNGTFKTVDDVSKVKGIGQGAFFKKIKGELTVGDETATAKTTVPAPAAAPAPTPAAKK